jgi:hypothetical protein
MRLFQNFSFGTVTLDLIEKAVFRPLFRKPVPKLTAFWNRLRYERPFQNLIIGAHFLPRKKPGVPSRRVARGPHGHLRWLRLLQKQIRRICDPLRSQHPGKPGWACPRSGSKRGMRIVSGELF